MSGGVSISESMVSVVDEATLCHNPDTGSSNGSDHGTAVDLLPVSAGPPPDFLVSAGSPNVSRVTHVQL